jgi:hypothetical protein
MKTLVLGHGRTYEKEQIRCSPINVNEWFNDPFDCVDNLTCVKSDILFNLRKHWIFASDESYDRIVDCTGGAIQGSHGANIPVDTFILNQVQRILKPYGLFYPDKHFKNTIYQKDDNGELVLLENKIVPQFLRQPISTEKLERIKDYVFVQSGTYTVDDYIESDAIKAEYEKKMEKYHRYSCNLCNTDFTIKENHLQHLYTKQHRELRSKKLIEYSSHTDKKIFDLYDFYKTTNICRIIKKEENCGISI